MVGIKASHYWRQMTELKKFDFPWILTSWVAAYKKTQYISDFCLFVNLTEISLWNPSDLISQEAR